MFVRLGEQIVDAHDVSYTARLPSWQQQCSNMQQHFTATEVRCESTVVWRMSSSHSS
jgi:hypothetical protein